MTETEPLHPELTADLVERVANLSPAAFDSLGLLRQRQRTAITESQREFSDEISKRLEAFDRGEVRAVDGDGVVERLKEKILVLQLGANP